MDKPSKMSNWEEEYKDRFSESKYYEPIKKFIRKEIERVKGSAYKEVIDYCENYNTAPNSGAGRFIKELIKKFGGDMSRYNEKEALDITRRALWIAADKVSDRLELIFGEGYTETDFVTDCIHKAEKDFEKDIINRILIEDK